MLKTKGSNQSYCVAEDAIPDHKDKENKAIYPHKQEENSITEAIRYEPSVSYTPSKGAPYYGAFASAQGLFRSRVGKVLGLRLTPTLEFIPDALPESAAALEDALAKAKAKDEAIAAASAGATYAGDADPYRHDDEEDDAEKDWA